MDTARAILFFVAMLSGFQLASASMKCTIFEENSPACVIYINIATCKNCNALVPVLLSEKSVANNSIVRYLMKEQYSKNGSVLLSEYLNIRVHSSQLLFSDSLIQMIEHEIGFSSALILQYPFGICVFNLEENVYDFLLRKEKYLNVHYSRTWLPEDMVLSDNVWLGVFEQDTFIIDRNIGIVNQNGRKVTSLPKFIWEIEGLIPATVSVPQDSTNPLLRLEYTNMVSVDGKTIFIFAGNQLRSNGTQAGVYPETFAIEFVSDRTDETFTGHRIYKFQERKRCYFDDYSIVKMDDHYFMINECGAKNLSPFISQFIVGNNSIILSNPKRIKLSSLGRRAKGYSCELGDPFIYFFGTDRLYRLDKTRKLNLARDFQQFSKREEYLIGASLDIHNTTSTERLLIKSGDRYKIVKIDNSIDKTYKHSKIDYAFLLDPEFTGLILSNAVYNQKENSFMFVADNNAIVKFLCPY